MDQQIWMRGPARHWEEALPIGNGRLGAMLFGGSREERIALNEETFWSGYPRETDRPGAAEWYPKARDLALEGDFPRAQALVDWRKRQAERIERKQKVCVPGRRGGAHEVGGPFQSPYPLPSEQGVVS